MKSGVSTLRIGALAALLFCGTSLLSDAITIDMNDFRKLTTPAKIIPAGETVTELKPIGAMPRENSKKDPTSSQPSSSKYTTGNLKEDTRDSLIRELRQALETGKDFKYYFPNFDYSAFKKDIEAMMRDIVSQ